MSTPKDPLRDEWSTPPEVFGKLDSEFRFELDVCASIDNARMIDFLAGPCAREDHGVCFCGLCQGWGAVNFMNCPYSDIKPWVDKAQLEAWGGATVVGLLPSRTERGWYIDSIERCGALDEVRFVYPRIQFVPPEGVKPSSNREPSILMIWRPPVSGGRRFPRFSTWTWK